MDLRRDLTAQIRPTADAVVVKFSEKITGFNLGWDWIDDPMFIPLVVSSSCTDVRLSSENDSLCANEIDEHTVQYPFHSTWPRHFRRLIVIELKKNIEESVSDRYDVHFK